MSPSLPVLSQSHTLIAATKVVERTSGRLQPVFPHHPCLSPFVLSATSGEASGPAMNTAWWWQRSVVRGCVAWGLRGVSRGPYAVSASIREAVTVWSESLPVSFPFSTLLHSCTPLVFILGRVGRVERVLLRDLNKSAPRSIALQGVGLVSPSLPVLSQARSFSEH